MAFGDRWWDGCCTDKEVETAYKKWRERMNPKDAIGKRKPLLHLVPPVLSIWVAEVFRFSAPKYGPYNWRTTGVNQSVYLDATMRHLLALTDGQLYDPETGLPHEAHIAANMAIMLDAASCKSLIYDHKTYGQAGNLMQALTKSKEENHDGSKTTN